MAFERRASNVGKECSNPQSERPMKDNEQVLPVQVNRMARLAGWASVVNIVSWLLMAIPGFLHSFWSIVEYVTLPLSAMIALAAGIMGLLSKAKTEERGVGQCVIAIFVGIVNVLVIGLVLMLIFAGGNIW